MNTQYQIVPGSIGALAQQSGKSIAESFLSAEVIVIVDVSGSMDSRDSRGNRSRYEVACEELAALQQHLPGKIAVIGFSNGAQFHPGGIPVFVGGGTDMAGALGFTKVADAIPGMRFILISDGEPDDKQQTLRVAQTFKNRIDVIFVGPEDRPAGRNFLQHLAAASGGQIITADRAQALSAGIQYLLKGGEE
jgi:Mg-chelatase subunit ChlD